MRSTSEWEFNIKYDIIIGNILDLIDYIDSTIIDSYSYEKFDAIPYNCEE